MNHAAYDINYLLESETFLADVPVLRVAEPPPRAPAPPSLAQVHEALARELLQAASAHDEWIRHYARSNGDVQTVP